LVETGDREPEARVNLFMSELLGRQGELPGARAYVERALTASVAAHAKGMQARTLANMAWLSLLEGDWRGARRMAEEALGIAKSIGSQYQMARLYLLIGQAMLSGGQEGAVAPFESARAIAQTIGAKTLESLALFGMAAADPYGGQAPERVAEAQAILNQLAASLDEEGRACFLSLKERQQVLGGDYIGFGLPSRNEASRVSPSRLVMNQGLWKMQ
jgi:tetratricopeptide (TPR) repeat protein